MDLMFEQYLLRLERRERSPLTLRQYRTILGRFDRYLAEAGVAAADADVELVEGYFHVDLKDYAKNSQRAHLDVIRGAYRYAQRRGVVRADPTWDVYIRKPEPDRNVLSAAELRAIRDEARTDVEVVGFYLLAYTGMRRFEVSTLRWESVHLAEQWIDCMGKGSKRRQIPIHPALGEILADTERRSPQLINGMGRKSMHQSSFGAAIGALAARAGVDATPHDFRRTWATSLIDNGVDEVHVEQMMGHSRGRSVLMNHYVNTVPTVLAQAILQLYRRDPL